jgi:hypothetical protein
MVRTLTNSMKYLIILVLTASVVIGCQRRNIAAQPRVEERVLTLSESEAADPFAAVAQARGIPHLRTVLLPEGVREVRLADSYSWIAGYEVPMLRIVQEPNTVTGEISFFWRQGRQQRARRPEATCVPSPHQWQVCVSTVAVPSIDWGTVAARLDSLGVWTLSASCENLMSISDAGNLLIQRLDGERFETYSCSAPRSRSQTDAGRRARALFEYLYLVARSARP